MLSFLGFLAGLSLLVIGAAALVRGASEVAKTFQVPALVIGLTVVAYGTSMPELAVSLRAAVADNSSIAVGNIVGSNTFNVLLILGISALVTPIAVRSRLIRLDIPLMIAVSGIFLLLAQNRGVGIAEGAGLMLGLVAYTALTFILGRREEMSRSTMTVAAEPRRPIWRSMGYVLIGLRWTLKSGQVVKVVFCI